MKRLAALALIFALFLFAGCTPPDNTKDDADTNQENQTEMTLTINGKTFTATLYESETAQAFAKLLPLTLEMQELNGNEKYYYLDGTLPTNSEKVGTIHAGDIMLYGNSCVVLFYQTFSTPYSYTKIGRLNADTGIAEAAGNGAATVKFEIN